MAQSQKPRSLRLWPFGVLVLYGLLLAFALWRHEPWRDELQAWLLARDSQNLKELWQNTRYEGHPLLWHLLLFLAARIWPNPAAMQVLHFFVALTVAALLLFRAPFPFPLRVGLIFSYFFLFEYGAISRNYALTALFLLAFSCLLKNPPSPLPAALMAAAASHSSPMGLLAFPALVWWLFSQKRKGRFVALSVALPIAAAAVWSCWPPPDSGYARPLFLAWEPIRAQYVLRGLAGALLPVVPPRLQFWNMNWLFPMPQSSRGADLLVTGVAIVVLLTAGRLLYRQCGKQKAIFAGWAVGVGCSLAFFYAVFPGAVRHHGIFFLLTLMASWLAPGSSHERTWLLLGIPMVVGLWSSAWACSTDWKNSFSPNQATGLWLSSSPAGALTLVGFPDWAASGVAGWLPGKKLYYPTVGDYGTFVRWTKDRERREADLSPLQALVLAKGQLGPGPFLFLGNQPLPSEQALGCTLVFHSGPVVVADEAHWLYLCQVKDPREAVLTFGDDGRGFGGSNSGKGEQNLPTVSPAAGKGRGNPGLSHVAAEGSPAEPFPYRGRG